MVQTFDQKVQEKILAFTKYARFISEKFDVKVVFDGLNAHTDGRTITLPNLIGMSERDLDFLYCILLHEVGHIRYTSFSEKELSRFKTKAHFGLFNAIEDARIENLLMKDFDGAHDIFLKLYNEFFLDEKYMNKIFGSSLKANDLFTAITRYLHQSLISLNKKSDLKKVITAKTLKELAKFSNENGLETLLESAPLVTQQDAASLADQVYALCLKATKDHSEKNSIEDMRSAAKDALAEVGRAAEQMSQIASEIADIQNNIGSASRELESMRQEVSPQVQSISSEVDKLSKASDLFSETMSLREEISSQQNWVDSTEARREKKASSLDQATKKRDAIKDLLKNPLKATDKHRAQLAKHEQKVKDFSSQLKTYDDRLKSGHETLKQAKSDYSKKPAELRELSNEELAEMRSQAQEAISEKNREIGELERGVLEKATEITQLREHLEDVKVQQVRRAAKILSQIQEDLNEAGLDTEIVPGFQPTPGWADADEVQKEFDINAGLESGEVVVNGSALSQSGLRDIMLLIEESADKIEQIDLTEIFKENNHASLFDSVNDLSQINNSLDYVESESSFTSDRKHLSLTNEFDTVKTLNKSSGAELLKIRSRNKIVIEGLKNIFRFKLKFKKKNKFVGNREEGGLDTRSLWKLATKTDSNFYEQTTAKFVNDIAASIAIDISGSMDKTSTNHGEKLKELALMLSDALQATHVKHEVIGYHAPVSEEMRSVQASPAYNRTANRLETVVYKSFSDHKSNGLENIKVECADNSDGESLKIAGNRLIKERGKRKILFVVTDGKPYLSNSDVGVLDEDLRNTLNWLKSRGVEVYAFGFNKEPEAFYKANYCQVKSYEGLLEFFNQNF